MGGTGDQPVRKKCQSQWIYEKKRDMKIRGGLL
jgi:hypothetical protein